MIPSPEMLSKAMAAELARIGCAGCSSTTRAVIGKPKFNGLFVIVKVRCVNCERVSTVRLFGEKP